MRAIRSVTGMWWLLTLGLCVGGLCAGCEMVGKQGWPIWSAQSDKASEEQQQRMKFQTEQSTEAVRWLLSHRVRQGMSPQDVGMIIGEEGEPVTSDNWIKNEASGYQVGDETYRWGPDNKGNSYYLVFRDNRLVNYDPSEFREMLP